MKQSIEQLENDFWPDYEFETDLIRRCHEYRKIPISDLTNEMIRVLIGQEIGLNYLLPVILEKLVENPLIQGDLYACDVLNAVLHIDKDYWKKYSEEFKKLDQAVTNLLGELLENKDLKGEDREQALTVVTFGLNTVIAIGRP